MSIQSEHLFHEEHAMYGCLRLENGLGVAMFFTHTTRWMDGWIDRNKCWFHGETNMNEEPLYVGYCDL